MGGEYVGGVGLRSSTVGGYPPKCEKGGIWLDWGGIGTRSVPDKVNRDNKEKDVL